MGLRGRGSAAHRGSAVVVCLLAWSLLKLLLFVLRPLWVVSVPQSAILKLDRARRSALLGFGAHMKIIEKYDPSLPLAWGD